MNDRTWRSRPAGAGRASRSKWAALALLVAAAATGLPGCGGGGDAGTGTPQALGAGSGRPVDSAGASGVGVNLAALPLEALSEEEQAGLLFMREEEQLAHDVYLASAQHWALPIFANITDSETAHASAIATLLARYGIADPMVDVGAGVFPTPEFQTLYDVLAARSRLGLIEALQVGCEIEELDMRDIAAQLEAADNADIRLVYEHLLRGSRNHLRAFYATLQAQGGSYLPQYLTQEAFDAIVDSEMESGS